MDDINHIIMLLITSIININECYDQYYNQTLPCNQHLSMKLY